MKKALASLLLLSPVSLLAPMLLLPGCATKSTTPETQSDPARSTSSAPNEMDYSTRFPAQPLDTYPHYPLRTELGESLQSNEREDVEKSIRAVEAVILKRMKDLDQKGRGDHSTSHGCYEAEFRVNDKIQNSALETGIASRAHQGNTYKAVVRYSNAETPDSPDLRAGSMGVALKIYLDSRSDLNDSNFLLGAENKGLREQDFLAGIHKTFLARAIADYSEIFNRRVDPKIKDYAVIGVKHPSLVVDRFLKPLARGVDDAPIFLEKRFWSTLPYSWGDKAAKFSFLPCHKMPTGRPGEKAKELRYQKTLIENYIGENDVCHKLVVQVRPSEIDPQLGDENQKIIDRFFPIEDAKFFWPEEPGKKNSVKVNGRTYQVFSPFQEIATVTVAKGTTALSPEQCEKTVFNPWNGLKEHQPLGSLGRARLSVYKKSKNVRYQIYKSN